MVLDLIGYYVIIFGGSIMVKVRMDKVFAYEGEVVVQGLLTLCVVIGIWFVKR